MAAPPAAIPAHLMEAPSPHAAAPVADRAPAPAAAEASTSSSTPAPSTSASASQPDFSLAAPDTIKLGDQVIIYSSRNAIDSIIVTAGKDLQSRYGHYKHEAMVGVAWGSKFASASGKGYVYLLRPTPELWTLALPHRTQILYLPDIAFISSYLDIKPGSKVIEAGTGSGSFSHSVARAVGKQGRVHSFEYHEERYGKAKAEFEEHNLADVITLRHRNVCQDGFDLVDEVDSVFLDVPAPWEAVPHAKTSLRKDRQARVCCFSPCIEQVLRTVSALSEAGFSDITMYETLLKTHEPAVFFQATVEDAIKRIEAVEQKKSVRREGQIADARRKKEHELLKRKRARQDDGQQGDDAEKASRAEAAEDVKDALRDAGSGAGATSEEGGSESAGSAAAVQLGPGAGSSATRVNSFKQGPLSRGHTSFLTFATLLPTQREKKTEVEAQPVVPAVEATQASENAEQEVVVRAIAEETRAEQPQPGEAAQAQDAMEL